MFAVRPLPDVLGGGVYWPRGDRAAIIVDPSLNRLERLEATAEELIHDEDGGGVNCDDMPDEWAAIVARYENRVHDEVARRLIPRALLIELIDALDTMGLPVEAWDVAQQFDVSERVAARRLRLLARELN